MSSVSRLLLAAAVVLSAAGVGLSGEEIVGRALLPVAGEGAGHARSAVGRALLPVAGEGAGHARSAVGRALLPVAGERAGSARVERLAAPVVRSQSPEAEACEPRYCSDACEKRGGWRGRLDCLVDLCCLKHRCFRQMFPYNSCYKPLPPYLLENGGYNTSCWRRLPEDCRPCPPVIEGYPTLLQPVVPVALHPADEGEVPGKPATVPPPAN